MANIAPGPPIRAPSDMDISVVIPTCNRKARVLQLLQYLQQSLQPVREVIVVDAGEDRLSAGELAPFAALTILYLECGKSVCMQRNLGIQRAQGEWIFLCDDDMEVPPAYLQQIAAHVRQYPDAGAVSGLVLQQYEGTWTASYPMRSSVALLFHYVFQLSIWGEIRCAGSNFLLRRVQRYYRRKGNHITKAGWPVITDFSGAYFTTPVYGLGASVVKRSWLLQSPYAEVLDRHGIGDNYGVCRGFPVPGVQVLNNAFVYHHHAPENRLQRPLQYYRRMLALHYFTHADGRHGPVKKGWLLWSLAGNLLAFVRAGDTRMVKAALKTCWHIAWEQNPYCKAALSGEKVVEPVL